MIRGRTVSWLFNIRTTALFIVCMLVLAACNPLGDAQRYVRAQQLKHTDVIPPTASAYVGAAGLSRTIEITFPDPTSNQLITITDRPAIHRVLSLLANGRASTTALGEKPAEQLKLTFTLDQPDHAISMIYFPDQNRVSLYNVPTPTWPEHYVGNYTVAPEFGAALLSTLKPGGDQ